LTATAGGDRDSGPSVLDELRDRARAALRSDGAFWRKALLFGVERGPDAWVRYSPGVIGASFGLALPWARERAIENLRRVHGPRPRPVEVAEAGRLFASYGSSIAEALLAASGRGYEFCCDVRGGEIFDRCRAEGRGVIVATAHTAGWEVAGPALRRSTGEDVLVVMHAERDSVARGIQDRARERAGLRIVHAGEDALAPLPLLRHLRAGGTVAVQIDRAGPTRSRPATLFGHAFAVPEGPLRLAAVTGAPVVCAFTRRTGFMQYETRLDPAIRLPRHPTSADLDEAAQALASRLEAFVRAYPTQWFDFGTPNGVPKAADVRRRV